MYTRIPRVATFFNIFTIFRDPIGPFRMKTISSKVVKNPNNGTNNNKIPLENGFQK